MSDIINCSCGNKGCSTTVSVSKVSPHTVDVIFSWKGKIFQRHVIELDANNIVRLIHELREALLELGE